MALFHQAPNALCILRLSALGDVCHALATVEQIRQHWQQTEISWIVGRAEGQLLSTLMSNVALFEDNGKTYQQTLLKQQNSAPCAPLKLIVFNKKMGFKGMLRLWKFLSHQHFDALLNMQTALRASVLSLGIKAKYKIGFGNIRSREMQSLFVNRRIQDPASTHVLDGFLAFAEYIGVPTQKPKWDIKLDALALENIQPYLAKDKPNLLIAPCSSKSEKDWLAEGYAEIASRAVEWGANVILCGSPAEREQKMAQKITALCPYPLQNAVAKTSLSELVALISQADLLLAPDSGPAHIATLCETAVIGLYAYHNPLRTGPYYQLDDVISVYEKNALAEFGKPVAELAWATKLKGKNLMAQISADEVWQKIHFYLEKSKEKLQEKHKGEQNELKTSETYLGSSTAT